MMSFWATFAFVSLQCEVFASPPEAFSLLQQAANWQSALPGAVQENRATQGHHVSDLHLSLAQYVDENGKGVHPEEDHDQSDEVDHHLVLEALLAAFKAVDVAYPPGRAPLVVEGREEEVLTKLEFAMKQIDSVNITGFKHAAKKLSVSKKFLAQAIAGMKATPIVAMTVQGHLQEFNFVYSEAVNIAQRACAKGEVQHAMKDVLKALVAVVSAKPGDAKPFIEHAIKCVEHSAKDLEGMIEPRNYEAGKPLHQDNHAKKDIKHAKEDLEHALADLAEHQSEGHVHTGEDTQCMLKDLKHVLFDLKCANDDLLTAQALFDLKCANGYFTKSFFQTMMRQMTPEDRVLLQKDLADDIMHGAALSLASGTLYRSYAARLTRAAKKLTKSTTEKAQKLHDYANKYVFDSLKVMEKKGAKHHVKVEKKKCNEKCHADYEKCYKAEPCKSLTTYAKNEKACWAMSKSCKAKVKECYTKCKATKTVRGYYQAELPAPAAEE
jgi:hypothetical protein